MAMYECQTCGHRWVAENPPQRCEQSDCRSSQIDPVEIRPEPNPAIAALGGDVDSGAGTAWTLASTVMVLVLFVVAMLTSLLFAA